VLVVEDQAENRLLMRRMLEPLGFALREATDGAQGVALAGEWKPDLVLLDRRMPVMDGIATAKILRSSPSGKDMRIVAVTAHAFHEEQQEMLDAGCNDFLTKPFRADDLFAVIEKHLPVEFVRTEAAPTPPAAGRERPGGPTELKEALCRLPASDLEALRAALNCADVDAALDITGRHPELPPLIHSLLEAYRYDVIAVALPESEPASKA
jgi:CheY-like chemotaxis protein